MGFLLKVNRTFLDSVKFIRFVRDLSKQCFFLMAHNQIGKDHLKVSHNNDVFILRKKVIKLN